MTDSALRGSTQPPPSWRRDLHAALPSVEAADAVWIANLNEDTPWRAVVARIGLHDGTQAVLKYHNHGSDFRRELAANAFVNAVGCDTLSPCILGASETRRVIVFEYVPHPTLAQMLETPDAAEAWQRAACAIGMLHARARHRLDDWFALCPGDRTANRLPCYDLPLDELIGPFERWGLDRSFHREAIFAIRERVSQPESWLGFTHSDLQPRHILLGRRNVQCIDWERAGLRHALYDLACLIDKPGLLGKLIPSNVTQIAIRTYSDALGTSPADVRTELTTVRAYEHLIGLAESPNDPVSTAICLRSLANIEVASGDEALALIRDTATELLATQPDIHIPTFQGFA